MHVSDIKLREVVSYVKKIKIAAFKYSISSPFKSINFTIDESNVVEIKRVIEETFLQINIFANLVIEKSKSYDIYAIYFN